MATGDANFITSNRHARDATEQNEAIIRCIPRGICSWNFLLDGAGYQGTVALGWMGEHGTIKVDGTPFDIQKHGVFSGHWTLNHEGQEVISAQKSTAFTRTFKIQDPRGELVLRAKSPLGRSFHLERSNDVVATMSPDHAFTRRATISIFTKQYDLPTLYFSFWLVVLMWRRAAQRNNG